MKVRLLLSTRHSGSHFLKSFIETHFPTVVCSGEMLQPPLATAQHFPTLASHPEFPHFWPWYESGAAAGHISVAPDRRIAAFETYLSKLAALIEPRDLVIDTKYNSIRSLSGYEDTDYGSHDYVSFIRSREIPVLHFIRKNLLRVVVSNKLAEQNGNQPSTGAHASGELPPKIRLNPKSVLCDIRYAFKLTQDYQNRFSGYAGYTELIYEDLVRDQSYQDAATSLRTLGHFLGTEPSAQDQTVLRFKTTPKDPSEVVENWQDVIRLVRTTEHGWMTDAPLLAAA